MILSLSPENFTSLFFDFFIDLLKSAEVETCFFLIINNTFSAKPKYVY